MHFFRVCIMAVSAHRSGQGRLRDFKCSCLGREPFNFLTNVDLSDNERGTVTASLQGWCGATGADPESLSVQTAAGVAIDLLLQFPKLTAAELLELLLLRLPAAAGE